jgi:hypothetical protein
VSDLVSQPRGQEFGVEAEALGLRVGLAGEMLQANERDTAAVDDKLAGVRGADTDHEHDVDVAVHIEDLAALLLGRAREAYDVGARQHRRDIVVSRIDRGADDVEEVRCSGSMT